MEPKKNIDERCFASSRLSDQADCLASSDFKGNIVYRFALCSRIGIACPSKLKRGEARAIDVAFAMSGCRVCLKLINMAQVVIDRPKRMT